MNTLAPSFVCYSYLYYHRNDLRMLSDCIDLGSCHACLYGLAVVVFYSQNQLSWCMS